MIRPSRDLATTPRGPRLSDEDRLALYEAQGGVCPLCTVFMPAGTAMRDEHLRALGLGGSNAFGNRAMVHAACADLKTHGPDGDLSRIAAAKRSKRHALGFVTPRRPMPGSRSDWRSRGLDGLTRDRTTGVVLTRAGVIDVRSL